MTITVMLQQLAGGMVKSIGIFGWTLVFSLPLGLLICFGRMSKCSLIRNIIKIYISVMRGTPLMLQLLVIYYGPFYIFGLTLPASYRFTAVIVGFSLNYAAYFAEIYRSGIESMPVGQYEAAQILGYSKRQTFFTIILPQVIKRILPALTNEVITLVKDTSLAFSITYLEMFSLTKQIAARETSMVPFAAAAVFYYVFNLLVAAAMERIERKLDYYK